MRFSSSIVRGDERRFPGRGNTSPEGFFSRISLLFFSLFFHPTLFCCCWMCIIGGKMFPYFCYKPKEAARGRLLGFVGEGKNGPSGPTVFSVLPRLLNTSETHTHTQNESEREGNNEQDPSPRHPVFLFLCCVSPICGRLN